MTEIILKEQALVDKVYRIVEQEGTAAEDFVEDAVRHQIFAYQEKRIRNESQTWYALSSEIRNQYRGVYIAMLNGKIVDNDPDKRTLYIRIRERYGDEPVLIVEGGDAPMPTYYVRNVLRA